MMQFQPLSFPIFIFIQLKQPCQKAVAVSGNVGPVANVAACEAKCTAQAAAAPGTGEAACVAVDTDGSSNCYMKSHCEGKCSTGAAQVPHRCGAAPVQHKRVQHRCST